MLIVAVVATSLIVVVALGVAALVYGPALDERLGFFTGRDLKRFLAEEVGGTTIAAAVEARLGEVRWRTSHRDFLDETDIECTTAEGRHCCWTLSHRAPRSWLPRRDHYITPTNSHAASLIPELPPGTVRASMFSEQAWRPGVVYDMAEPEKARELFEPFLRKRFPQFFTQHERR